MLSICCYVNISFEEFINASPPCPLSDLIIRGDGYIGWSERGKEKVGLAPLLNAPVTA
jgi:hypothetical protein